MYVNRKGYWGALRQSHLNSSLECASKSAAHKQKNVCYHRFEAKLAAAAAP